MTEIKALGWRAIIIQVDHGYASVMSREVRTVLQETVAVANIGVEYIIIRTYPLYTYNSFRLRPFEKC